MYLRALYIKSLSWNIPGRLHYSW